MLDNGIVCTTYLLAHFR